MNPKSSTPVNAADAEIISSRLISFPRDLVFRAWTEPNHLKQWWGPNGFTNTFNEFDLQPGGYWRFIMHGPDGHSYENESIFREIVKPSRIVFDHLSNPKFQVVATFADESGKTLVTFRMLFESADVCQSLKKIIVPSNEQNFDRLEAELAKMK